MKHNSKTTIYQCSACGYTAKKWIAKCPSCSQWNTLQDPVQKEKMQKEKEDRSMFIILVLIPMGLLCTAWIWSRYGFGYGVLAALFFAAGAYI